MQPTTRTAPSLPGGGRNTHLELLLDIADDRLTLEAGEGARDQLRVHGVAPHHLAGDAQQLAHTVRGQLTHAHRARVLHQRDIVLLLHGDAAAVLGEDPHSAAEERVHTAVCAGAASQTLSRQ